MHQRLGIASLPLLALVTAGVCTAAGPSLRGIVLSDFETGQVDLESYDPAEDEDPDAWELTEDNTHGGSAYSLRLFGNTWKAQEIAPYAIGIETVLSVASFIEDIGEIQALGVSDGTNVLLYTFAGTQLPTGAEWEVAYQGAFATGQWNLYALPIGRDWNTRYGYLPQVRSLIYVNDRDATSHGATLFDDIIDITADLPIPPDVEIVQGSQQVQRLARHRFRVGIQFHADVYDPDSETFSYLWDFGDSTTSVSPDPFHEFTVESDHLYTVRLEVRDESGMGGGDSAQVRVDPGEGEPNITMNFVGDVMLARRYDDPGGLIDTYGPEYIFMPTRSAFGGGADINVCNLECPLTDEGTPHPTKPYVFRGRPSNVAGLTYAGIDLVSIGNNHIMDFMDRGMEETQEVLDAAGIRWSGAGFNEYFALQPTFWTERGVAIAFLGQCNRTGREYNYQPFLDAAANKPGFGYEIEPNLGSAIASVRDLADLVVVQLHSGIEYETDPGTLTDPSEEPPFDAVGTVPGGPEIRFRTRPSYSDRQLRWRAVDQGANLVICHHPHVLQGFEVYNGVLIAHSLGNFVFDQSFAETFPSVILYSGLDKTGFRSFTFRPAFIDDMIPRLATGRLGREILDRMADYSRELDTVVGVDPEALEGTIFLDSNNVSWAPFFEEATVPLSAEDEKWVSPPIERTGAGTLSRILAVEGGGGSAEIRVGREILWHGDFEEEGATFWDLNSIDEVYDESTAQNGRRSLRQHRTPANSGPVRTDLEGYPPATGGTEYSVLGYVRTENAREAGFAGRFFRDRGGQVLLNAEASDPVSGTQNWTYYARNFQVPSDAYYFNVRCHMERPASGDGYAWFDGLRLVAWEPWQAAVLPLEIPSPSNLRYLQVRFSAPDDSARVQWEDRRSSVGPGGIGEFADQWGDQDVRITSPRPNPFDKSTMIGYRIARADRVQIEVYDLLGRRAAVLEDAVRGAGWHQVEWDARGLPSGLYLCRIEAAGRIRTQKLVLLR